MVPDPVILSIYVNIMIICKKDTNYSLNKIMDCANYGSKFLKKTKTYKKLLDYFIS